MHRRIAISTSRTLRYPNHLTILSGMIKLIAESTLLKTSVPLPSGLKRKLCCTLLILGTISIPFPAYAESGAQVVQAIERTIGGEPRIDLLVAVLDEKGNYRLDYTLLTVEETLDWKAGGQKQSMLVMKYYLLDLDALELDVARHGKFTTNAPKPKVDSKSGSAYKSLPDIRKFRIDARARIKELEVKLQSVDSQRYSGVTPEERLKAHTEYEKYFQERNQLLDIVTTSSGNPFR